MDRRGLQIKCSYETADPQESGLVDAASGPVLSPRIPPEFHWKQWVCSRDFHETLCSNSKRGLIL